MDCAILKSWAFSLPYHPNSILNQLIISRYYCLLTISLRSVNVIFSMLKDTLSLFQQPLLPPPKEVEKELRILTNYDSDAYKAQKIDKFLTIEKPDFKNVQMCKLQNFFRQSSKVE